MKILVVDDIAENRYFAEALLKGNGYEVHSASNGAEALFCLKSGGFDLIISDILMPVMDGFELCRKVKADKELCHIPFLIYTSTYTSPEDMEFAMKIKADQFLLKPCEPDAFMEAVRILIASDPGSHKPLMSEPLKEEEVLKLYSERLINKLEQKMLKLEEEAKALQQSQRALSRSEIKYRRLHESMMDGYVYLDMQGCIRESNDSFQSMLGYTDAELAGLSDFDLTPEKWHAFNKNILSNQVLLQGYSDVYEKEYKAKDNRIFPVELRTFLVRNESDEEKGMWSIVRDLTERKNAAKAQKKLEKQLYQSQKMEAIGTLAGGIAHDFNNILSGIFGYAQLAQMNCDNPEKVKDNIDQVVKGARRASELVHQILTFCRQSEHEKKPLRLYLIIKEAVKFLKSAIPSNIDIIENISSRKAVLADATQVHQVVMNLCTNAYYAMGDAGGKLTVSLTDIIETSPEDSIKATDSPRTYLILEIKDTGCGMDQVTMERAFDPYFTTKNVGQGTGLGLAVVDGIVKKHEGFIKVSSEPGQGSVFQVFWPTIDDPANRDPIVETKVDRLRGAEKIMLVEDEESTLEATRAILENLGYRVAPFKNGAEALQAFESDPEGFDIVITDMSMPKMMGDILSKRIIAINKNIPVILCTGFNESFTRETALKAGIRRYIQKPVTGKDLALIIRETLKSDEKN